MDIENVQVVSKLSTIYLWSKQSQKKYYMRIGREDDKNISIYVDFLILCNVVLIFTELSAEFSKNGITFTLL